MFKTIGHKTWFETLPVAVLLTLISLGSGGCFAAANELVEESRQVSGFSVLSASIAGRISIAAGETESLTIEAKPATVDRIVTELDDEVLHIGHVSGDGWWRDSGPVHIRVTYAQLHGLRMSGSADVMTDAIATTTFDVRISGSSNIQIPSMAVDELRVRVSGSGDLAVQELAARAVSLEVSGSGDVALLGRTDDLTISVIGSGNVDGAELAASRAEVVVRGSGDVVVNALEALDVQISGSGNVDYIGQPDLTRRISGSGDLEQR